MVRIGLTLLFCIVCSSLIMADDAVVSEAIEQYQQALRTQDTNARTEALSDSERAFENHLKAGYANPATYYNLGVVALRQGHIGRAIAALAHAHALSPRSERIAHALTLARHKAGDTVPEQNVPQFISTLMSWHTALTEGETAWTFLILWITGCLLIGGGRYATKRLPVRGGAAVLIISLLFGGSLLAKTCFPARTVVVTVAEGQVRSGAGDHFLVTYHLPDGSERPLLQELPGWRQIRISEEETGWIATEESDVFFD